LLVYPILARPELLPSAFVQRRRSASALLLTFGVAFVAVRRPMMSPLLRHYPDS
jgi:hypothetical protein